MCPLVFYEIITIFIFLQQVCDSSSHLSDQQFFFVGSFVGNFPLGSLSDSHQDFSPNCCFSVVNCEGTQFTDLSEEWTNPGRIPRLAGQRQCWSDSLHEWEWPGLLSPSHGSSSACLQLHNGCIHQEEAHITPTHLSLWDGTKTACMIRSDSLIWSCDFFMAFVKCTFLCHPVSLQIPFFFIFFDENIWFACEKTYFPTKPSSINQTDAHWI